MSSLSIYDVGDDWAGVDVWESPGILSAAEAHEAEDKVTEIERKLEDEEKRCALLAESAKIHLEDMASLFEKVKLSTATRAEMERMSKIDEELKRLKADLTASKSAIKTYSEDMVKSMSKTKTYALMKTAKEQDIRRVIEFVREAETVDLAFLLDCTASMGPHIESAKSCIKDVVRRVKRTNEGLNLRVAVVGYRDLDNKKRFEVLGFTSAVDEFETFVSSLVAHSGPAPDIPEDIAGAIQKACDLSWQQTSRVTFLIADTPCHGNPRYHNFSDNYPSGTPGICIEAELKKLMKLGGSEAGMHLHFGRITPDCDQMIRVFGENGFEFEVCDLKEPTKLASTVSSSVRKSISKSITASKSKSKSDGLGLLEESKTTKKYTIREAKPSVDEWKSLTVCPVKVLCNKPISSINDFKTPLLFGIVRMGDSASAKIDEKTMLMRRAEDPFAEGEMRLAYYGKLGVNEGSLMSDRGDKILKCFKKESTKSSSGRRNYLAQMEVSTIAHFLAEEYNKTCRPSHCAEIRFLTVYVVETDDSMSTERFCAEDQLPLAATAFTKYSNNTGYWNEDAINQSLLLFTRFTHEKTGGYLMVTDLQGVRNGNQFILTDPAILCKDKTRFGDTNLGQKFIEKCMTATGALMEEYGWDD